MREGRHARKLLRAQQFRQRRLDLAAQLGGNAQRGVDRRDALDVHDLLRGLPCIVVVGELLVRQHAVDQRRLVIRRRIEQAERGDAEVCDRLYISAALVIRDAALQPLGVEILCARAYGGERQRDHNDEFPSGHFDRSLLNLAITPPG